MQTLRSLCKTILILGISFGIFKPATAEDDPVMTVDSLQEATFGSIEFGDEVTTGFLTDMAMAPYP